MNNNFFDQIENLFLAVCTKLGLWITPLVPAYFVQRAMVNRLDTPSVWGWIAAAALEIVGIAATKNLLRAYTWNQEKRKTDPPAPLWWTAGAAGIYYVTAFLLVLVTEFLPSSVRLVPAAFVILSGASALVIALSADQYRRQQQVNQMVTNRSAKRQHQVSQRSLTSQPTSPPAGGIEGGRVNNQDTDRLQQGRLVSQHRAEQALLTFLADHPLTTHAEAADHVGRSRPWVTGKINDWLEQGLLTKNGHGLEVNQ